MFRVLRHSTAWIFLLLVLIALGSFIAAQQQWMSQDTWSLLFGLLDLPLLLTGILLAGSSFILSLEETPPRRVLPIVVSIITLLLFIIVLVLNFSFSPKELVG